MNRDQMANALTNHYQNKQYYILIHDHKHGYDISLHSSYNKAQQHGISLMKDMADVWGEDMGNLSDKELWDEWPRISGETEFFTVEQVRLDA